MMLKKFVFGLVVTAILGVGAFAESIIVNGAKITGVEIFESSSRVYIEYPDGKSESYPKTEGLIIGEKNIKAMEEAKAAEEAAAMAAAAAAEAAAKAEAEAAAAAAKAEAEAAAAAAKAEAEALAAAKEAKRMERAQLQLAGAATVAVDEMLEVNTLVIAHGGVSVAFVSLDIAFIEEALTQAVAAKLQEMDSLINRDNLILAATGVNTGLYTGASKNRMSEVLLSKFDEAVFNTAVAQIADAVHQAEAGMEEAVFRIAESDAPAYHTVRDGASPTPDSTLNVFYAAKKSDGAPLAYLINYALSPALKVEPGLKPEKQRGLVGALSAALREKSGAPVPVVFFNGAAGDIVPNETANIAELADVILAAKDGATGIDAATLSVNSQKLPLPPSLMAGIMPGEALLQQININSTAMLAIPASLASQWGQLLRAKAAHNNVEHVFLLTLAGDFIGYNPAIDEFLKVTEHTRLAFYGPLTGLFFAQNYLGSNDGVDIPSWIPPLNDQMEVYKKGFDLGVAEAQNIATTWESTSKNLNGLVPMLQKIDMPEEAKGLISNLSKQELLIVGKQLLSIFVRGEFAPYDRSQLIQLIGVAQGSNASFDAVFLLQLLSKPEVIAEKNKQVAAAIQLMQLKGINFLP